MPRNYVVDTVENDTVQLRDHLDALGKTSGKIIFVFYQPDAKFARPDKGETTEPGYNVITEFDDA